MLCFADELVRNCTSANKNWRTDTSHVLHFNNVGRDDKVNARKRIISLTSYVPIDFLLSLDVREGLF
jgi:hypothetical protein